MAVLLQGALAAHVPPPRPYDCRVRTCRSRSPAHLSLLLPATADSLGVPSHRLQEVYLREPVHLLISPFCAMQPAHDHPTFKASRSLWRNGWKPMGVERLLSTCRAPLPASPCPRNSSPHAGMPLAPLLPCLQWPRAAAERFAAQAQAVSALHAAKLRVPVVACHHTGWSSMGRSKPAAGRQAWVHCRLLCC